MEEGRKEDTARDCVNIRIRREDHSRLARLAREEGRSRLGMLKHLLDYYGENHKCEVAQ
jgi:hypothetical protein